MIDIKANHTIHAQPSEKVVSSVAMMTALISFTMLFATLMLGFVIYRLTSPVWPPQGMMRPSLLLPAASTFCIALSSYFYVLFEKSFKNNDLKLFNFYGCFGFGILFIVLQFVFWNALKSQGILVSSGLYPSIIYAFSWIHAAHVIAAFIMLLWLFVKLKTLNFDFSESNVLRVENVGKFWHFLGIVWLIMFVTIFIL